MLVCLAYAVAGGQILTLEQPRSVNLRTKWETCMFQFQAAMGDENSPACSLFSCDTTRIICQHPLHVSGTNLYQPRFGFTENAFCRSVQSPLGLFPVLVSGCPSASLEHNHVTLRVNIPHSLGREDCSLRPPPRQVFFPQPQCAALLSSASRPRIKSPQGPVQNFKREVVCMITYYTTLYAYAI